MTKNPHIRTVFARSAAQAVDDVALCRCAGRLTVAPPRRLELRSVIALPRADGPRPTQ